MSSPTRDTAEQQTAPLQHLSLPNTRASFVRASAVAKLSRGPSRIAFVGSSISAAVQETPDARTAKCSSSGDTSREYDELIALTDKEEEAVSKVMIQRGLTNVRHLDELKSFLNNCGESILDEEFPLILTHAGLSAKWEQSQNGAAFGLSNSDLLLLMRCIKMRRQAEHKRIASHGGYGSNSNRSGADVEEEEALAVMNEPESRSLLHSAREVFLSMSADGGATVQSRDLRKAARAFHLQINIDELVADLGTACASGAGRAASHDSNESSSAGDDDDRNDDNLADPETELRKKSKNRQLTFEEFEYLLNVVESRESAQQQQTQKHMNFFAQKEGAVRGTSSNSFIKRVARKRGAIAKISVDLSGIGLKSPTGSFCGSEEEGGDLDDSVESAIASSTNEAGVKRTFTNLYANGQSQQKKFSVSLENLLRREESVDLGSRSRSVGGMVDSGSDEEDSDFPVHLGASVSGQLRSTPFLPQATATPSLLSNSSFACTGSAAALVKQSLTSAATPPPLNQSDFCRISPTKLARRVLTQGETPHQKQQRPLLRKLPPLPQKLENARLFSTTPTWAVSYTAFIHKPA